MMRKRKETLRGLSGFTLVELMIAIGIIGIMAAISYPIATSTMPNYRLRAEVRELIVNFKKAKLEAIKRNRNVMIAFTPAAGALPGSYQVFVDNSSPVNGTYEAATDILLTTQQIRPSLLLTNVTFANNIGLNPLGLAIGLAPVVAGANPPTNSFEIRLADGSNRYRLVLSTTGAVRVESSRDGGVTWTQ